MDNRHATIIGAGIIGMSTAAFLQRQGYKVTVIDRVPPGEGCSFGNAGGIAFAEIAPTIHPKVLLKLPGWLIDPLGPLTIRWSYLPKALPWFLAAARNATPSRVAAITKARADLGFRAVGDFEALLKPADVASLIRYQDTIRLYDSEAQFEAEAAERRMKAEHGFAMKKLSGGEVRELEPAVSPHVACGAFHGGWYFVTNPQRVVQTIAADVVSNGGTLIADDVVSLNRDGVRVASLSLKSGGTLAVDELVVCAGAYSHLLAKALGDMVLLEAERGCHIVLPDSGVSLSRSITYARTPGVATPMEMGLRLAGTDEFAGLDAAPNYARADRLWELFKKSPARPPPARPDGHPLDGPPPRYPRLPAGDRPFAERFKRLVRLRPRPHGPDLGANDRPLAG